jgi:hypothetical protein
VKSYFRIVPDGMQRSVFADAGRAFYRLVE